MKLFEQIKFKIKVLKRETAVVFLALKDRRTPLSAKICAAATVGYLLSPIDLIPDFIPVLGMLDDLVLVPLLISLTLKLIPKSLVLHIRATVDADLQLQKKWYFALPIVFLYLVLLLWLYFKLIRKTSYGL